MSTTQIPVDTPAAIPAIPQIVRPHAATDSTPPPQGADIPAAAPAIAEEKIPCERRVSFQLPTGELVETVVGCSGFFSFWVQGDEESRASIVLGGTKYEPQYGLKPFCEAGVVRFPAWPAPYGTTAQLLDELKQFIQRYADLPQDWLDIVCLYVLMTWVYDRFMAVPYLRFLGEPGTGKTRYLQVCSAISYKGTLVSGNITGPALFRTIDLVRGTMAVDEADFKNSAEWSDVAKVLNNGYSVGTPVIRCNKNTFDPECFQVFGPKIISTRNRFEDEATETRCLTLETKEQRVSPHIPLQLPLTIDQEALALRNKLLRWRFDNFDRVTVKEEGLRNLFARSGQIGASLAAVAPDEAWLKKLFSFLQRLDEGRDEESPKGMVQRSVASFFTGTRTTARVNEITEAVNSERQERGLELLSARKVGGILRSLGFAPRRTNQGYVVMPQ